MKRLAQPRPNIAAILDQVKISDVYQCLTGTKPRRAGSETWRAPAKWRDGDGLNVSLDDSRGVWHDFVSDDGGGILDLVVKVRGGSRQGALQWVSEFAGIPLDDRPLSAQDRKQWVEERQRIERYLPVATLWRRAVAKLTDELLDSLKAALFGSTLPWPEIGSIYDVEQVLHRLERIEGAELVDEYIWWATRYPATTANLVKTARAREQAERRALLAYLRSESA